MDELSIVLEEKADADAVRLVQNIIFSFQARPFYERRGYEVFGALESFAEHTRYFLRKKLEQPVP